MTRGRDAGLYAGGLLFQQVIAFLTGVAAARWLGPAGWGHVNLARAAYGVAVIVAPLGLDLALLRRLGEEEDAAARRATVEAARRRVFLANLILVGAAALLGPWLGRSLYRNGGFAGDLLCAFAALPFAADLAVLTAWARAERRVADASLSALYLQPLARTAVLAALLGAGLGARGILLATAGGLAAADLLLSHRLRRACSQGEGHERTAARDLGALFGYSGWMAAMLLAYNGLKLVDVLTLGWARPAREVGEYAALAALAQLIGLYPQALSQTLAPTIAGLHARGDRDGMRRELGLYVRRAGLVASPLFAGLAAWGPWLDLLFGGRFHFDGRLSLCLSLGAYVGGVFGPMSTALSMTGRHRLESAILLLGGAVALGLCLLLAPGWGALGVGLATLFAYGLVNGLRAMASARITGGSDIALADLAMPASFLALAYGCRTAAERFGGHDLATTLAAMAALGASDLLLLLAWLRPADREALTHAGARVLDGVSRRRSRSGAAAAPCRS